MKGFFADEMTSDIILLLAAIIIKISGPSNMETVGMRSTILHTILTILLEHKCKNWNLFAGDLEYRTDFFLRFYSDFTTTRYLKDRFQRSFFPCRAFVTFSAVIWTFLHLSTELLGWPCFLLGLCCLAYSYHAISVRHSPWSARLPYLFIEYFGHKALAYYGQAVFLTFFSLPTNLASTI